MTKLLNQQHVKNAATGEEEDERLKHRNTRATVTQLGVLCIVEVAKSMRWVRRFRPSEDQRSGASMYNNEVTIRICLTPSLLSPTSFQYIFQSSRSNLQCLDDLSNIPNTPRPRIAAQNTRVRGAAAFSVVPSVPGIHLPSTALGPHLVLVERERAESLGRAVQDSFQGQMVGCWWWNPGPSLRPVCPWWAYQVTVR